MSSLAVLRPALLAATPKHLAKVRNFERAALKIEQTPIATEHLIHGGLYARTCRIPAGVAFTGALTKLPTTVIVNGRVRVTTNEGCTEFTGYNVIPGSAGRKQAFLTLSPIEITMIFPTKAQTVAEAEAEITGEASSLMSRRMDNGDSVIITGE